MSQSAARPRSRIESFSDLIFGLALSIGAIALIGSPAADVGALFNDVLGFAFNFLILISVWMRYTRVASVLPLQQRRNAILNTILLFTVSLEPFLFNTFRSGNTATPVQLSLFQVSSALYGIDLGTMMIIMGAFTTLLADEEKKLVPADMLRQLRRESVSWYVGATFFLVSAAPIFDSLTYGGSFVRTDLWLVALLVTWVRRGIARRHPSEPPLASSSV